jgi:hypothetical protein
LDIDLRFQLRADAVSGGKTDRGKLAQMAIARIRFLNEGCRRWQKGEER